MLSFPFAKALPASASGAATISSLQSRLEAGAFAMLDEILREAFGRVLCF